MELTIHESLKADGTGSFWGKV